MAYSFHRVMDFYEGEATIEEDMYDTYQSFRRNQRSRNYTEAEHDVYFTGEGELEEIATMELSVIPPTTRVDNEYFEGETRVIIEGANRLGTLVEISQCVTEMNLSIRAVYVCSDDGWCFNELRIVDPSSLTGQVLDPRKVSILEQMLNPHSSVDVTNLQGPQNDHTVLELSGPDRPGLLSEVTEALESSGFKLCSVAVWTSEVQDVRHSAFVLSIMDGPLTPSYHEQPSATELVKERCEGTLKLIMQQQEGGGQHDDDEVVIRIMPVDGPIHHDRRLHQLLHAEDAKSWAIEKKKMVKDELARRQQLGLSLELGDWEMFPKSYYAPSPPAPQDVEDKPYVFVETVETGVDLDSKEEQKKDDDKKPKRGLEPYYWHLHLRCKDRTKLLLDVASTLADMNFDVRHAAIDTKPIPGSSAMMAEHTYWLLPKVGSVRAREPYDERKADLVHMMQTAVTRRFAQGQKIKLRVGNSREQQVSLGKVATALTKARLNITRAHVLPYEKHSTHTFVVTGEDGQTPPQDEVTGVFRRELGGVVSTEGSSYSPCLLTLST